MELRRVLDADAIVAVHQPIVELATGATVGYEALARGPDWSDLQRPDQLFAAARAAGLSDELDCACRAAAVRGALDAALGPLVTLFVNVEPSAAAAPCPARHADLWARATEELDIVIEFTERGLTDHPAELWHACRRHRDERRGIALDDVGADVRSLALLPLVEPDVVKLDLRLVRSRASIDQAAIVSAVAAEQERTRSRVLAEGIETDDDLEAAFALGAVLGTGWHFGHPGPLPAHAAGTRLDRSRRLPAEVGRTPFEVVSAQRATASATKRLLLPMSHHLEDRALSIGEGAVVLSAFQDAEHMSAGTLRRYETIARSASLVAALGRGIDPEPAAGVRGAQLAVEDEMLNEWSVVVLGPHFSGALVALDSNAEDGEVDRPFTFAITYERGLVIAAARTLVQRIAPRRVLD